MSPEKRRELASKGGKKSQKSGKGHRFTPTEASAAGRLGAKLVAERRAKKAADMAGQVEVAAE